MTFIAKEDRKIIEDIVHAFMDESFLESALDSIDIIIKDGYATEDDRIGKCLILLKGIAEGRTQMLARLRAPSVPLLEAQYVIMESEIFKHWVEELRRKLLSIIARRYKSKADN